MNPLILPAADPASIEEAVRALRRGAAVAFPTDTVYGLGALATVAAAIGRLYDIKGRDETKAIAILLAGDDQLPQVATDLSPAALTLARRFWPGALTLVVPRHPSLPDVLSPRPTIGVRVPDHAAARALLAAAGPLAVTSANLSGAPDCTTAAQVAVQLGGRVELILDGGETPGGVPSTVVDTTGTDIAILRGGPVSEGQIRDALSGRGL
ncbi:MAG: threonylcarbamoyl-AMP synthase [Anaerolineae bacterium]|nr:MAG: threonylcarbamoyl-AMP synthase [Anaerolineae bacterium]